MRIWRSWLMTAMAVTMFGCTDTENNDKTTMLPAVNQENLETMAAQLDVTYSVNENRPAGGCTAAGEKTPCYLATLSLTSPVALDFTGWSLYFSQVDPVAEATSEEFVVEHLNGDLHRISPTPQFSGFDAGETKTIQLVGRGVVLSESKLMPNYYVVANDLEPEVIASTQVQEDPETGLEIRPYATSLTDPAQFKSHAQDQTEWATSERIYEANAGLSAVSDGLDGVIIPTPAEVTPGAGNLDLAKGIQLQLTGVDQAALQPALDRLELFGVPQTADGIPLAVTVDDAGRDGVWTESYTLNITDNEITVAAADSAGAFYALQSIASLLVPGVTTVPQLRVVDQPRYSFRGVHIDVARNFHSKELLLNILDEMAAYKLNKLHLHLGDDEGWRLEIAGLPELTDVGSRRCHDLTESRCLLPQLGSGPHGNSQVDGYYSIEEYQDILRAADARNIQVIPSFDMPGHSRAVIKAMEARYRKLMKEGKDEAARQYLLSDFEDTTDYESIQFYGDNTINVCMESTYKFIDKVMDEMQAVHTAAGQPLTLYHIGADETAGAWVDSPICKQFLADNNHGVDSVDELGAYFIERVANLLADKGIKTGGWNDGLGETNPDQMPEGVQSNLWALLGSEAHHVTHQHINNGWDVVLSLPDILYFDFPQSADPKEHGYYWGSRETTARDVFDFMPDNLPVHAEFRTNQLGQPYTADDRVQRDDAGNVVHRPRAKNTRVAGIQGQIWSETLRSDEVVEYMLFPRMVVLAERAWHKPEWAVPYNYDGAVYSQTTNAFTSEMRAQRDAEWNRFANSLAHKVFPKLDRVGMEYRLPTVGAKIENGILKANISFPGLGIEYRVDGGEWQPYTDEVKVNGKPVDVRAVAPDGKRKGRSLRVS